MNRKPTAIIDAGLTVLVGGSAMHIFAEDVNHTCEMQMPKNLKKCIMQQSPETNPIRDNGPLPLGQKPKGKNRLLVVEDCRSIQQIICSFLRKMGLKAELAENGQMACEMAEKSKAKGNPYTLILMDMQMPQMNGYEATQWLRTNGWQGPIVAVTAYETTEACKKCLDAGCDDHLSKPITETALRNVITRHLNETHQDDHPRSQTPLPDRQAPPKKNNWSESVQVAQDDKLSTGLSFDSEGPRENTEIEFL